MYRAARILLSLEILLGLFVFTSCESVPSGIQDARVAMAQKIQSEPPGDYFIGRRYYKPYFKIWGYVRRPGQPWSTAQLVMLNEKKKLAPDREHLNFGEDNNYEYKLYGSFSGEKVYEPASNTIYPEFVLEKYELISTSPPPIFKSQYSGRASAAATRFQIEKPE
ncbi:MAG: hypothetical protein ABJB22_04365 [Verrucomicrobiota bacterium]